MGSGQSLPRAIYDVFAVELQLGPEQVPNGVGGAVVMLRAEGCESNKRAGVAIAA